MQILRTSKSIGNARHEKNAFTRYSWPCLLQDVLNRRFVQNKPAAVAPKETITHHFFVSGIGQGRKLSMQPKFVAAQKMLLKQKPSKHS